MVSVLARREQVTYATRRGLSQRRACTLMKGAFGARLPIDEGSAGCAGAGANGGAVGAVPRYGYHRIRIFLGRPRDEPRPGVSAVAPRLAALTLVGGVLSALHASCA
jgi:hypothetical protein